MHQIKCDGCGNTAHYTTDLPRSWFHVSVGNPARLSGEGDYCTGLCVIRGLANTLLVRWNIEEAIAILVEKRDKYEVVRKEIPDE